MPAPRLSASLTKVCWVKKQGENKGLKMSSSPQHCWSGAYQRAGRTVAEHGSLALPDPVDPGPCRRKQCSWRPKKNGRKGHGSFLTEYQPCAVLDCQESIRLPHQVQDTSSAQLSTPPTTQRHEVVPSPWHSKYPPSHQSAATLGDPVSCISRTTSPGVTEYPVQHLVQPSCSKP